MNMVRDADLTRDHDVIARGAGAGNPHLTDQQIVSADFAVVADLHEIVDLRAFANDRGLERAAVDGGAGADFHVVADLHMAQLRNLVVASVVQSITESVRADHRVGRNRDAMNQDSAVVKNGMGIEGDVVAEPAKSADHRSGVNSTSRAHRASFSDASEREYARLGA